MCTHGLLLLRDQNSCSLSLAATAAATLSISPRKVRQINDPISQILNQLHKVIFITQVRRENDHSLHIIQIIRTDLFISYLVVVVVVVVVVVGLFFTLQLPPTLSPNPQRRIVERFKRALFAPQSSSFNLKSEVKKVPYIPFSSLLFTGVLRSFYVV